MSTLGPTTPASGSYQTTLAYGMRLQMPENGVLSQISFYKNAGANCKAAVYSDNAGEPDQLLAQTSAVASSTLEWVTMPLLSNLSVNSGTYIWLVGVGDVSTRFFRDTNAAYPARTLALTYASLETTAPAYTQAANQLLSINATYSLPSTTTSTNLNDRKHSKLKSLTGGAIGAATDFELAWLQSVIVATPKPTTLADAWYQYLIEQGVTAGNLSDMKDAWLAGMGYTGTLEDKLKAYWGA